MDTTLGFHLNLDKRVKDPTKAVAKALANLEGPLMLAVYLEGDRRQQVNIKTDSLDFGPHMKSVRIVPASKDGEKYTLEWHRSYSRGKIYLVLNEKPVGIHHISIFAHEEGGPEPKKGSLNYSVSKATVVKDGGSLYLVLTD